MKHSTITLLALALITQGYCYDLVPAWISRVPRDNNPMVIGSNDRPQPSETYHWILNVYNNGTDASTAFQVEWKMNGVVVRTNDIAALAAGAIALASNMWVVPAGYSYDFSKPLTNVISAKIIATGESQTGNNDLSVHMDALTLGVAVYTGTFHQYTQPENISFYEKMQETIDTLNQKFADAVFPHATNGILDRYRTDNILFHSNPDSPPGWCRNHPEYALATYVSEGGTWGGYLHYPWWFIGHNFLWSGHGVFSTYGVGAFCHECGHARQVIDIYDFNLDGANNHANPGVSYCCDWMDPPGKDDIMRSPYSGANSVFTEYGAIIVNRYAGQPRPVIPEWYNSGPGDTNTGYVVADLPEYIRLDLYANNGKELDGIPVKVYRGYYDSAFKFPATPFFTGMYSQGGLVVDIHPARYYGSGAKQTNCFQIALLGDSTEYHYIIDLPRLNYHYWMGETNDFLFNNTGVYQTVEINSVTINGGAATTTVTNVTVAVSLTGSAANMRAGNSSAELSAAGWQTYQSPFNWNLPPGQVDNVCTVFVQTLSADFVPSDVAYDTIMYVPEPAAAVCCLLFLVGVVRAVCTL